jgi:motility quorum-sensing regulator / GCU-specific mRNA interferase toxin
MPINGSSVGACQINLMGYYWRMEKSTPHCKLSVAQSLVEAGAVRATASAFNGARDLGIHDLDGMCAVVLALTSDDFYKSMTTYADHRIWQDVYRAKLGSGAEVYMKLTVIDDVLIVSFKEL